MLHTKFEILLLYVKLIRTLRKTPWAAKVIFFFFYHIGKKKRTDRSTKLKSSIFRPQLRDAIVKQPINSGFNIRPGLLQALRDEDHRACPQGLQATILTHHISFMPIKNAVLERPSQEHAVLPVINQFTIIIILLRKWCHVSTLDSSKALGQCFVVMRT